jgi:hypothetical protein
MLLDFLKIGYKIIPLKTLYENYDFQPNWSIFVPLHHFTEFVTILYAELTTNVVV